MRKTILPFFKFCPVPIMLLVCMMTSWKTSAQYCAATNLGGSDITNVTIQGTTLNNSTGPGPAGTNYTAYPATGSTTATLIPGNSYTIDLTFNGSAISSVWVDYNQDFIFDPSEWIQTSISGTTGTGTLNVPPTAVPGQTGMRVRSRLNGNFNGAGDACLAMGSGETEDYTITIGTATPCSGPVVAGVASGPAAVCPSVTFTVTSSGFTIGSGMSYQWEESPSGAGTFAAVPGATNPSYSVTGGITSPMDYQLTVTCSNGGSSDVSNIVTVGLNSFLNCYCTSNATTTADEEILGVLFGSINNTSTCATVGPPPNSIASEYSDYTATVAAASVSLGDVVPFTLDMGTCGAFTYNNGAKIFIDFNQNGLFTDPGEEVYVSPAATNGAHTESGTVTIPLSATPGTTRMRIVDMETGTPSSIVPCGTYGYGETEDYLVDILIPTPCAGTPAAGTANGPASICPNIPFNLSSSGFSVGQSGITFQWEESPAGAGTFTPIAGATNIVYTNPGITTDMDYHLVATCTNGGATDISNTVTVAITSFLNCYCTSGAINPFDGEITNVTVGALNNSSTCASSNQLYTDYTTTVPAVTMMQTDVIPVSVTAGSCGGSYAAYVKIFIDYDQDGTFTGPDEEVFAGVPPGGLYTPAGVAATGTFIVPSGATVGITRMRVILNQTTVGTAVVPCGTYNYGETEDYLVEIVPAVACTGTPAAGTASGPATVCPSVAFTLNASGFTSGSGISYQWEESPSGAATFTPISGATLPFYTVSAGITAAMDYHMIITCANGGATDVTPDITVNLNSFLACYCTSQATSTADEEILNVTFGGLNNSSTCATTGGPGSVLNEYSDYTATVPAATVAQGDPVPFSVQVGTCGGNYGNSTKIYIDYNQNGLFTDPGEEVFAGVQVTGPHTESGIITIPVTATPGTTRMRVITSETTPGNVTPCGAITWGETEDYLVEIIVPAPCSGTPTAGTASGPSGICLGDNFTLNLTGYSAGLSGITIQWESAAAGSGTFTPISGATNAFYNVTGQSTATDYHAIITCTNGGGTDVSNIVSVSMNAPTTCYCVPGATNPNVGDQITNVTFAGINNSTGVGNANGYNDYTATVPAGSVTQGSSYTASMTINNGGTENGGIWIDYDQNGLFDPSEFTNMGTGLSLSQNITIPLTATPGITRMRVRSKYGAGAQLAATDPCAGYADGETEDYSVEIIAAVPCAGAPVAGTASGPAGICPGQDVNLSLSGSTAGLGISIQWESSPSGAGTWTPISGATNNTLLVSGQTVGTDYHAVVNCSFSGTSTTSNDVTVIMYTFLNCYCSSAATSANDEEILNVTVGPLNNSSTCITTGGPGSVQNKYSDYTSVLPAANLAQNASVPFSISIGTCGGVYTSGTAIFIDFDQNGSFADPGEEVYVTLTGTSGPHIVSGNFTVPAGATLGTTRMRVINAENYAGAAITPCLTYGYGETEDYFVNITVPATCAQPLGLAATNVTAGSADVSWSAVTGAAGYEYAVSTSSTPPVSGTPTTNTLESVSGLSATTTYYLHVRTDCGGGNYSAWSTVTFQTLIPNDNASGAIMVTVGATCSGNGYTSVGATQSPTEPNPSCSGTGGFKTVWYSFVAPASGAVRISDDFSGGTLGSDTRMGLFSATDPNDYTTFTLISCDDDNGHVVPGRSMIYGTGLTAGTTYYIQVGGYGSTDPAGTFCLEVKELDNTMLASTGSCTAGNNNVYNNTGYSGWRSVVDNNGNLLANIKDLNSLSGNYNVNVTKNTGAVRADGSLFYLDRNFKINLASGTSTSFDVQFFFTDAELAALQAADPTVTLSNLNVTRQTGATCQANFNTANGVESLLAQTGNGSANGANWVTVNTPGFSNFYLMGGLSPLNVELKSISAINDGPRNRVDWTTGNEQKGDYFEVERSADAHAFTKVGVVNANGKASSYSFWDQTPVPGVNYYRLKLMSASGAFSYSKVVTATVNQINGFAVDAYPNPVSDQLSVTVYGQQGSNATVSICDVTGKVIRVVDMSGTSVNINMSSLAQGMYLIKYSDSNHSQAIKVNKQ